MAEETTTQDNQSVNVTDQDLSSAWEKAQTEGKEAETKSEETATEEKTEETQETKTEETSTEKVPEEPVDNSERSQLGRRVKSVEENMTKLMQQANEFFAKINQPVQQEVKQPVTYNENYVESRIEEAVKQGLIPETIITPSDHIKVENFRARLVNEMDDRYQQEYINVLKSPQLKGNTPDDIHAEVVAELRKYDSPFNRRNFDNPYLDVSTNYNEAVKAVLMKRLSEGKTVNKNVFEGKKDDTPPTGVNVNTKTKDVSNDLPELDEKSLDFIKRTGMSADSVNSALKKDMPLYLRGRR